jgi:hypothetical protein
MGPLNLLGIVVAALASFVTGLVWYGLLFGRAKQAAVGPGGLMARSRPWRTIGITLALALISAFMLGHMFARIGPATLGAKPWLYFMMSGGLALAFVIPALWTSYLHQKIATAVAMIDAGYWLVAYLAMGAVFWVLG